MELNTANIVVCKYHFNSAKVQFGEISDKNIRVEYKISIPLRYNLESMQRWAEGCVVDFNSAKVQFGGRSNGTFREVPPFQFR